MPSLSIPRLPTSTTQTDTGSQFQSETSLKADANCDFFVFGKRRKKKLKFLCYATDSELKYNFCGLMCGKFYGKISLKIEGKILKNKKRKNKKNFSEKGANKNFLCDKKKVKNNLENLEGKFPGKKVKNLDFLNLI